jgi:tetratricopeptide (TPR) repeat protein
MGAAYAGLAYIFGERMDTQRSFQYAQMAASVGQAERDDQRVMDALVVMSNGIADRVPLALRYLKQAEHYSNVLDDSAALGFIFATRGRILIQSNDYEAGSAELEKALKQFPNGGRDYARAAMMIGYAQFKLGRPYKARDYFEKADTEFAKVGSLTDRVFVATTLAHCLLTHDNTGPDPEAASRVMQALLPVWQALDTQQRRMLAQQPQIQQLVQALNLTEFMDDHSHH